MDIKAPQRLSPAFKDYLWGGRRLVTEFNKKCDFDKVAESWELSTLRVGDAVIGLNGAAAPFRFRFAP